MTIVSSFSTSFSYLIFRTGTDHKVFHKQASALHWANILRPFVSNTLRQSCNLALVLGFAISASLSRSLDFRCFTRPGCCLAWFCFSCVFWGHGIYKIEYPLYCFLSCIPSIPSNRILKSDFQGHPLNKGQSSASWPSGPSASIQAMTGHLRQASSPQQCFRRASWNMRYFWLQMGEGGSSPWEARGELGLLGCAE